MHHFFNADIIAIFFIVVYQTYNALLNLILLEKLDFILTQNTVALKRFLMSLPYGTSIGCFQFYKDNFAVYLHFLVWYHHKKGRKYASSHLIINTEQYLFIHANSQPGAVIESYIIVL